MAKTKRAARALRRRAAREATRSYKQELFNLRFQLVTGQLDNVPEPGQRQARDRARTHLQRERELDEASRPRHRASQHPRHHPAPRGERKVRQGVVVSDKMDKTRSSCWWSVAPPTRCTARPSRGPSAARPRRDQRRPCRRQGAHRRDPAAVEDQALARLRSSSANERSRDRVPMIQQETRLRVADNTGAREVLCIRVLGGSGRRYAVDRRRDRRHRQERHPRANVKKGDVVKAVVVRTRKENAAPDGTYIRFDDNACVLINEQPQPARDAHLRTGGPRAARPRFMKIVSLAPEVL